MADVTAVGERVKREIARLNMLDADGISDTHDLRDDLGLDSLDMVELTMNVESELEVQISDDEAAQARTVAEFIKLVRGKVRP